MNEKKFWCKTEMVPVIAGFMLNSLRGDLADFSSYSSMFSEEYITSVDAQKTLCSELIRSNAVVGQLKLITRQMNDKSKELRIKLNPLEGYLKLAENELDTQVADFGLKAVRKQISRGNMEGLIMDLTTMVGVLNRNLTVLQAKGMSPDFPAELTALVGEISVLNEAQSSKLSERCRMTDTNLKEFNKMWGMISMISQSAQAIYRGVDPVKLKDYTIKVLVGRASTSTAKSQATSTTTTDTPAA
ncbi:hypothetical protein [Microbacter margulisiae]|uniref:Uncharacterized protein n=1 Tax=Microbacter margulisiae TaxID=1350067 RepID=A0A7W5DNB6_9PORP|nr:hypothetical protein [Microbacter margulisiae]MBB3186011.1 hypothetical protein [Microbacter margulisiae]